MDSPLKIALVFQSHVFNNAGIIKGIADYERIHGDWSFYLDDQAVAIEDPSWLFKENFDGLICRHARITSSRLLRECIDRGIPCVSLDDLGETTGAIPAVTVDDYAMGQSGAEYFVERGFQNFAYCGFHNQTWSARRMFGYHETIARVGFSVLETECFVPNKPDPAWDFSETQNLIHWIKALPKPAAIMACNDLRAMQVIRAAREAGLLIPEEVAILGVGNDTLRTCISHPPISSIPINTDKWGYKAAETLHQLLDGKPTEKKILIEPREIVVRHSTDQVAIEDETTAAALRIIGQDKSSQLTVDDLAKRVGVSRSLLEQRFRKHIRKSPQEVIRLEKVNQIKELLIRTNKSLADIADALGFSHPEYVSVIFKRLTGETTRSFRARHRKLS